MQRLKFRDFIDTCAQHEALAEEVPTELLQNANVLEVRTWLEFERRLKASGADSEVLRVGRRIWQRYRVAARSSLR